jgi:hypothetical protein
MGVKNIKYVMERLLREMNNVGLKIEGKSNN